MLFTIICVLVDKLTGYSEDRELAKVDIYALNSQLKYMKDFQEVWKSLMDWWYH